MDIREESNVESNILTKLESTGEIHLQDTLLLDSMNYFSNRQFREAIIFANTALEIFVKNHVWNKLKREAKSDY